MPAYWIAHVTVTDPNRYAHYRAATPAAIARFGGRFLARGGEADVLEGPALERHILIAFPDIAAARACYASPEYQAAKANRDGACIAHVVIVDGASDA